MTNILVGYQKGGVGKTTIAVNLAYYLQNLNPNNTHNQVLLIDGDLDQSSSLNWSRRRDLDSSLELKIRTVKYTEHPDINLEFAYKIFDITGTFSSWFTKLNLEKIDTLIIPISLDQIDIDHIEKIVEELKNYSRLEPLKVFILINNNRQDIERNEKVRFSIAEDIAYFKNHETIQVQVLTHSILNNPIIPKEIGEGKSSLELSKTRKSYKNFDSVFAELNKKGAFK